MQQSKSACHVAAATTRWRTGKADTEREAGIPDRPPDTEMRRPFQMLLASAGYHDLLIEPRLGYIAWRAVRSDTGQVLHCAAIKELLRWIARQVPRQLGARHLD